MKIIKRGKLPNEKVYRSECRKCRSIIEFKRHEAKLVDNQRESYLTIKCPLCDDEIHSSI